MKRLVLAAMMALPTVANADVVSGVFQTQPGDDGAFAHIQMGPCATDAVLTCGTILRAYNPDGSANTTTPNLGKRIVWDMEDRGNGNWGRGKIWAPDRDKTYNSKMNLSGNQLTVEGCVAIICRGQTWTRFSD